MSRKWTFRFILLCWTPFLFGVRAYFSPVEDLDLVFAQELTRAQSQIEIANYNLSSDFIRQLLLEKLSEGVSVKMLLHEGQEKSTENFALPLQKAGAQARWVTEILHHKFALIDDKTLITSSANLSGSKLAKSFDENTLICSACDTLKSAFGNEFHKLFSWSNPVGPKSAPPSSPPPGSVHQNYSQAYFTSSNFLYRYDHKRKRRAFSSNSLARDRGRVELSLVHAINKANTQILIATAHFRSKPLYDALLQAHERGVDIKIILDSQEYLSSYYQQLQKKELSTCLAQKEHWKCYRQGIYFAPFLEKAGIDLYFKYYSFRWFFGWAPQMHNKYMIIDNKKLFTGSYNWSFNAEMESFENVALLTEPQIIQAYTEDFQRMLGYGGGPENFNEFKKELFSQPKLPLKFDPISLRADQVTSLWAEALERCSRLHWLSPTQKFCPLEKEKITESPSLPRPFPAGL